MIATIVVGVLLDILAWKYRKYAAYIIYYEMIVMLTLGLCPLSINNTPITNFFYYMWIVSCYFFYACDIVKNIVACSVTLVIFLMVEVTFVFNLEITMSLVFKNLLILALTFGVLSCLAMLVTYIAYIKGKLINFMAENINLLDRMHEGLIVISIKDKVLEFASKPAVLLLK